MVTYHRLFLVRSGTMPQMIKNHKRATFFMVSLVILAVLVAGCGAGSTTTAGTAQMTSHSAAPMTAPSDANKQTSAAPGATQQYLIKSLNITTVSYTHLTLPTNKEE